MHHVPVSGPVYSSRPIGFNAKIDGSIGRARAGARNVEPNTAAVPAVTRIRDRTGEYFGSGRLHCTGMSRLHCKTRLWPGKTVTWRSAWSYNDYTRDTDLRPIPTSVKYMPIFLRLFNFESLRYHCKRVRVVKAWRHEIFVFQFLMYNFTIKIVRIYLNLFTLRILH